jgi:DNA invertase Pin-like site-specific DNA recombinase
VKAAGKGAVNTPPAWHTTTLFRRIVMAEKHCIPGVLYTRMSSDRQEESIAQQLDWAERTCKREGVAILREFSDEAIAGDEIARRPGLQALIAFCEDRYRQGQPVRAIVTWNGDRFSRADSIRTAGVLCRLLDAGTTLMLDNEGWTDFENETDRVMHSIKQDLGRSGYVRSLAENVTRGAIRRAREGKWNGGRIPYGYVLGADGHLALGDPAEAEAVRWMFDAYERGLSTSRIAEDLNRRGVPPPRTGRPKTPPGWRKYTVWGILTNIVYTGALPYGRRRCGKYFGVSGDRVVRRRPVRTRNGTIRRVTNPPEDVLPVANAHPALVTTDLFDRTQQRLRASRKAYREGETQDRRSHAWPLSGLLFCAHCGGRMWGIEVPAGKGKRDRARKYACSTYLERGRGACSHNAIPERVILPLVFEAVRVALSDPHTLGRLRKTLASRLRRSQGHTTANLESLRRRAADLAEKVKAGTQRLAIIPADLVQDVAREVRGWKEEREQVLHQIAGAEASAAADAAEGRRVEEAMGIFAGMADAVREGGNLPEARDAAQALVDRVELHFEYDQRGNRRLCRFAWGTVRFRDSLPLLGTLEITAPNDVQGREGCGRPCP